MNPRLFRKKALDKLSSPEQLDELMQVTTSKGWIALIAVGAILLTSVVWSVWGSLPTKVNGQGMLIKPGGVFEIMPLAGGQVVNLLVSENDVITKDQIVAKVAQPALEEEIYKAEARLAEMRSRHQELLKFGSKEIRLQQDYMEKQSVNLKYSIQVLQESLKWLEEKVAVQEGLLADGLITKQTLLTTRQKYYGTQEEIERTRNQLNQISINELSLKNRRQQEALASELEINESERVLNQLKAKLAISENVVSPYSGRILEVLTNAGSVVHTGQPMFRMDLLGEDTKSLEAVLYIPPGEGKKIKPGMEIQIEPSTVKREEFGFIVGEVTRVAEFPSTPQGMMRVLKNNKLVGEWSKTGAPFEVYANLRINPEAYSGFQWSSSAGPEVQIYSGTICDASIIVRRQRPISLVIPILKEYTGI